MTTLEFKRLTLDVLLGENDLIGEVLHEAALDDLHSLELGTQFMHQYNGLNASLLPK